MREPDLSGGTQSIVWIFIPFVAENAIRQRGDGSGWELRNGRDVSPEAHFSVFGRDLHCVGAVPIHPVERASQRVLRTAAVVRSEPWVHPRSRPHAGQRVDLGVRLSFFVADERPIGCRSVIRRVGICRRRCPRQNVVFPSGFPEHLIAAEERQVHAGVGVARRLDVCTLAAGPVLIVSDGEEDPVVPDQIAAAVTIHPGEIADVEAVCLQPPHHRDLGTE